MELTNNAKIGIGAVAGAVVVGVAALSYVGYQVKLAEEAIDPAWTLVSNSDDGSKWYVNDSSLKYEDGRYVQGWELLSQAKTDKDGTRSTKMLVIYDCQGRQYRIMSGSSTAGPNGRGAGTGTFGAGPTRNIPPGTNADNVLDYVCKPLYNNSQPSSDNQPEQSRSDSLKQI